MNQSKGSISRRGFLARTGAVVGGVISWATMGAFRKPAFAMIYHCCYEQTEVPPGPGCTVRYGNPSSTRSYISVTSYNGLYYIADCEVHCVSGCGKANFCQARGAVCDDCRCSCTARCF
jgi:hypothetical protein